MVSLLAVRPQPGARQAPAELVLDPEAGAIGDTWLSRGSRHTPDGSADPAKQITVMNARCAELIAGGRERMALTGDQIFVDFDLSVEALQPGDLLQLGAATVRVSAAPHRGCAKFVARFGTDAMRLVGSPVGRRLRLRGLNATVVRGGAVRVGDAVRRVPSPPLRPSPDRSAGRPGVGGGC